MEEVVDLKIVPSRMILTFVAKRFGFTVEQILGLNQRGPVLHARWMAIRMMERQGYSSPVIGKALKRDYSSILWAMRRMAQQAKVRPEIAAMLIEADIEIRTLAKAAYADGATLPKGLDNPRSRSRIKEAMDEADRRRHEDAQGDEIAKALAAEQAEAERQAAAELAQAKRLRDIADKLKSSKFERLKRERWSPASISKQMDIPIEYVKQALGAVVGEAVT